MIEMVVALCLFIIEEDDAKLKEHYLHPTISSCLKAKREGERNVSPEDIMLTCDKVLAETELEEYDGRTRILEIVGEE